MKQPDPKLHQTISFAKSAIRIAAGCILMWGPVWGAGLLLIIAELLGIVEELV